MDKADARLRDENERLRRRLEEHATELTRLHNELGDVNGVVAASEAQQPEAQYDRIRFCACCGQPTAGLYGTTDEKTECLACRKDLVNQNQADREGLHNTTEKERRLQQLEIQLAASEADRKGLVRQRDGGVKLAKELTARIQQLELQLAACGVAANDGSEVLEAKLDAPGWSPAYADVLNTRRLFEDMSRHNADLIHQYNVEHKLVLARYNRSKRRDQQVKNLCGLVLEFVDSKLSRATAELRDVASALASEVDHTGPKQ